MSIETTVIYTVYADDHQQLLDELSARLRSRITAIKRRKYAKKRDQAFADRALVELETELDFMSSLVVRPKTSPVREAE